MLVDDLGVPLFRKHHEWHLHIGRIFGSSTSQLPQTVIVARPVEGLQTTRPRRVGTDHSIAAATWAADRAEGRASWGQMVKKLWFCRARVRTNRPFWLQILCILCFHECSSIFWMSYDVLWDFLGYIMIYVSLGDLFGFVRFRVLTSRTLSYRSAGWKWRRYEYWSEKDRKRTEHEYLIHLNPRIHTPQSSQPGWGADPSTNHREVSEVGD